MLTLGALGICSRHSSLSGVLNACSGMARLQTPAQVKERLPIQSGSSNDCEGMWASNAQDMSGCKRLRDTIASSNGVVKAFSHLQELSLVVCHLGISLLYICKCI